MASISEAPSDEDSHQCDADVDAVYQLRVPAVATDEDDDDDDDDDMESNDDASPNASPNANSNEIQPRWKRGRYQLVCVGLILIVLVVAIVGSVFAVRSVDTLIPESKDSTSSTSLDDTTITTTTPTTQPSSSQLPTPAPSLAPSKTTSLHPSHAPTDLPSGRPSPSEAPTMTASESPTTMPSTAPSVQASSVPSSSQGPSQYPSTHPSDAPTQSPSTRPSLSSKPSADPTESPSTRPSLSPSSKPSTSATPSLETKSFAFYVMGDIPYAPWEETMLQSQMADMTWSPHETALFTVHVGDLQKPARTLCSSLTYQTVFNYLRQGPLPTFVLPGDNDWADCPDRDESLGYYRTYFNYFDQQWTTASASASSTPKIMAVDYSIDYPEIFRFIHHDILFLSVHLIDTKPDPNDSKKLWEEWDNRMAANIEWVYDAFSLHPNVEIRAVVIFGHGQISQDTRVFFEGIVPAFLNGFRTDMPVLYLHGDGHNWDVNTKISTQLNWDAFIDIQVDQGAFADPLVVEIAIGNNILEVEHELQYVFANGLLRVDRQRGRYPVGGDGRPSVEDMQQRPNL